MKTLRILGIRGIPASHGGFETFAEHLALYLKDKGWRVVVYCQEDGSGPIINDEWQGIERVRIPVKGNRARATVPFDWLSIKHAAQYNDVCLTLGYNTALFNLRLWLKGTTNLFNMDGLEWTRAKWGSVAKLWLWLNDWAACLIGTHLIADNPAIESHLHTRVKADKVTMIPYGANAVESAPEDIVQKLGLEPGRYMSVIARPEPENSVLEIVRAFSAKPRGCKLAVLGGYNDHNPYHREVKQAASDEVVFLGTIYEPTIVQALRFHSMAYIHGHQVGGTNPSLVEAMGAGNAIICHDNPFNRWVAGPKTRYFESAHTLEFFIDELIERPWLLDELRQASRQRFEEALTWPIVMQAYEQLLERHLAMPKKST